MEVRITVALYFIAVTAIGIVSWFKVKTPADYYVAGKRAGIFQISGSLLATIIGGSAIIGTIELSREIGWAAVWLLLSASAGLICLVPLSKYVSRYGKNTLPELLGLFYGKRTETLASIIIPVAWLGVVSAQIITAAKILIALDIVSYREGAILAGTIFTAYTLIGGQISILKTDTFQALLIVAGISIVTVFIFNEQPALLAANDNIGDIFNASFTPFDLLILFLTYSVTYVVGPDIYSRIFCARSERTASRSVLAVALALIPLAFMIVCIGVYSVNSDTDGIVSFAEGLLPGWMYGLFLAALLSAVMSSADTTLLNSAMILGGLCSGGLDKTSSLRLTRIFICVLGAASIVISIFVTSIIDALLFALTLFSGAFTVPVLLGLLNIPTRKHNITGAIVLGGLLALSGKVINTFSDDLVGNIVIVCSFAVSLALLVRVKRTE